MDLLIISRDLLRAPNIIREINFFYREFNGYRNDESELQRRIIGFFADKTFQI
jgi:hypothetical protein